MKKLIAILILCLLLAGCSSTPDKDAQSSSSLPTQSQADDSRITLNNIPLGISPQRFLEQLTQMGMAVEPPDYDEITVPDDVTDPKDGRVYNLSDYSFYYNVKGYKLHFTFDEYEKLTHISCFDSRIATPKGLHVGDSEDTLKKIYGQPDEESNFVYSGQGGYLIVSLKDGKVIHWIFTKHIDYGN